MKVVAIAQARRELPSLVRRVAASRRSIAIGRRGKPEVMLAPLGGAPAVRRRPLAGLIELRAAMSDAEATEALRAELAASVERTARLVAGGRRRPR